MDLNKRLEELKPYQLNCNIFSVYDYDGLTMQELLCQFFTKINECVNVSNETLNLAEWLVNEGLEKEVVKKLMVWMNDGTLENLINVNLFKTLNDKISVLDSQLEDISLNLRNFKTEINDWNDAFEDAFKTLPISGGTIYISGEIEINRSIDFREFESKYGKKRVVIHGKTFNNFTILKNGDFDGIILTSGNTIRNLSIKGKTPNDSSDGIWIVGASCILENIGVYNQGGNGIKIGSKSSDGNTYNCDFSRLYNISSIGNGGCGILCSDEVSPIFNTGDANANVIYSPTVRENKKGGILFRNCIDNQVYSPLIEGNKEFGIKIGNECGGIHIYSAYTERNEIEILLDAGSRECIVFGYRCGTLNDDVIDKGVGNLIVGKYGSKFNGFYLPNTLNLNSLNIGDKGTSGYFKIMQNNNNALELICSGSANAGVYLKTPTGSNDVNLNCGALRLGVRDRLNSFRIRPSSLTQQVEIGANTSVSMGLSSMTSILSTDVLVANPLTKLPDGISYYIINTSTTTESSAEIIFVNSTSSAIIIPQTVWRVLGSTYTAIV